MEATSALEAANKAMTSVISQLTPEHRQAATPCTEWNVHQAIDHVCQGCQMVAGSLAGQTPPQEAVDLLADGPATGWANAYAALSAAATPEALAATHQMPFGEVTGDIAVSAISADAIVHAWDVAKGAGVDFKLDDDVAEWTLATWQQLVPADGREGGFADVVPVPDDASPLDRMLGYTGRQP